MPTVESQLLSEPVQSLDLSDYCVVTADTPVHTVIARMRDLQQNCAIVVGQGTQVVGIFTDRDVLKRVVSASETWELPVAEVMTAAPDTVTPESQAGAALKMMDEGHYRNVPVVSAQGVLRGNLTHFSILKFLTEHFPQAVYNLPPDPTNFAQERDGG
jgi:CBS domain-containing protein